MPCFLSSYPSTDTCQVYTLRLLVLSSPKTTEFSDHFLTLNLEGLSKAFRTILFLETVPFIVFYEKLVLKQFGQNKHPPHSLPLLRPCCFTQADGEVTES